ncbi:MAG TPA: 4-(cytidine 5'-diphospho)-2-C-methyl-D-erythritol kinase [Firmicutes bacterium]|nr:4-(cytidine 5'-diphospho)-2-C-methyl-D-erythritol kinase [Bacillota bacterium]
MRKIKIRAYAKLNLVLDVINRRADGYHEVEMVMQSIDLYDQLQFLPASSLVLEIAGHRLPNDERNIIIKTAKLLKAHTGFSGGARIGLRKKIPVGAGLGGGSADAAATLVGLNQLWGLDLPFASLEKIGAKLGADIPFCLQGGTVLAKGIGEQLTPLPPLPSLPVFLAKPPFNVSTALMYKNLDLSVIAHHPDVQRVVVSIQEGAYQRITENWGNLLEEVTLKRYPELKTVMDWLASLGLPVRMSGSGPTLFIFGANPDQMTTAVAKVGASLRRKGWWTYYGFLHNRGFEIIENEKRGYARGERTLSPD